MFFNVILFSLDLNGNNITVPTLANSSTSNEVTSTPNFSTQPINTTAEAALIPAKQALGDVGPSNNDNPTNSKASSPAASSTPFDSNRDPGRRYVKVSPGNYLISSFAFLFGALFSVY